MANEKSPSTKAAIPEPQHDAPAETRPNHTDLHHRTLLDHPASLRPFRDTRLFERIGGQPTIDRLVDLLYDGFEEDELLHPLFPRDLAEGRSMQKLFFAEWLGGPRHYSEEPMPAWVIGTTV